MKGDLTRSTFDRTKHFSSVRMQQGRVQLDADWNEQQDIDVYLDRTEARDVIGACGAPDHLNTEARNFQLGVITPTAKKDFTIATGRIYVEGLLCENEVDVPASAQPDLPLDAPIVLMKNGTTINKLSQLNATGTFIAYLDVWQRHVTALEDTGIRETALNGPDTATRLKTVWQVKLLEVDPTVTCSNLSGVQSWKDLTAESTGTLTAQVAQPQGGSTPCDITGGGGFRGLENQLYRVEVHKGGKRNAATFKWSRDNGFVVTRIKTIDGPNKTVAVEDTGKDAVLGFAPNQWVEILDDDLELLGIPGQLTQVDTVNPGAKTIVLKDTPMSVNTGRNAKVRRWDHTGTSLANGITMGSTFATLEDGIEVKFADTGKTYRSGDYWLVPARSSLGDIEWPQPGKPSQPLPKTADGIRHYFCPLGVLTLAAVGSDFGFTQISDCRKLFAPLTGLITFFYVGGDGQEAQPGMEVPQPLEVGVADPQGPIVGAAVRFRLMPDNANVTSGKLNSSMGPAITVLTGSDGVAKCVWELGPTNPSQRVEATLLETTFATLNLPVRFSANLSMSEEVGYRLPACLESAPGVPTVRQRLVNQVPGWPPQSPQGVTTVKDVLDALMCRLDAGRLPYDPTATHARWEDIAEVVGSLPTNVQAALDNLVTNLESTDIGYVPTCGPNQPNTVRGLLGVPAAPQSSKVSFVLDKLMCELDAKRIPINRANLVCDALKPPTVLTVQDALEALCARAGLAVNTGMILFTGVTPGSVRFHGPQPHGLGNQKVTISLAYAINPTPGGAASFFQGSAAEAFFQIRVGTAIDAQNPDEFSLSLWDQRPAPGTGVRSYAVRWWAIPATNDVGVANFGIHERFSGQLLEATLVEYVRTRPGLTVGEIASRFQIPMVDMTATVNRLRTSNQLILGQGNIVLPRQ